MKYVQTHSRMSGIGVVAIAFSSGKNRRFLPELNAHSFLCSLFMSIKAMASASTIIPSRANL